MRAEGSLVGRSSGRYWWFLTASQPHPGCSSLNCGDIPPAEYEAVLYVAAQADPQAVGIQ